MNTYLSLLNFTHQGEQSFRESPLRVAAFKKAAKKVGVHVREVYWTLGHHDGAIVFQAANDEAAAATMLALGSLGNVRTVTLRAFNAKEFAGIIAKSPKL